MDAAPARIAHYLEQIGADTERDGERRWGVRIPSEKRGALLVGLEARERTLAMRAFVMRGPDVRHEEVYRALLRRNLRTSVWRFALDDDGDVHAVADVPLDGLDADALDGLLGALIALVDESYEGLVRTGFDVPEGTVFGPPPGAD